jgi:hypothetical protein
MSNHRTRADQVEAGDMVSLSGSAGVPSCCHRVLSDSITTIWTSQNCFHFQHNDTVWVSR